MIDDYISYKRWTKTVLDWLSSQSSSPSKWAPNGTFHSTRAITDCARCLPDTVEVPLFVTDALRKAITARRSVHQWYKRVATASGVISTSDTNDTHEAFIDRLEQTLYILMSKQTAVQTHLQGNLATRQNVISQGIPDDNRFAPLFSVGSSHGNAAKVEDKACTDPVVQGDDATKIQAGVFDDHYGLEDDHLGDWIRLNYILHSLDALLDFSAKNWTEAANGTLPFCLAAWLSSLAFYEVGRRYSKIEYNTLHSKLNMYQARQPEIRFTGCPGLGSDTRRFMDPQWLSYYESHLEQIRNPQISPRDIPLERGKAVDPTEVINPSLQDAQQSGVADSRGTPELLMTMRQLLSTKRAIAAIEVEEPQSVCEKILPLFDAFCSHPELPLPVELLFGLEMLLSSSKAYMSSVAETSRRSCRILGIRFALEVRNSFLEALGVVKKNPGSISVFQVTYLQRVLNGLEGYTKEIRFDIYHQAPWTAGCHMIEILTTAMFEGLHLCYDTGYLGALLHLYNALWRTHSNFRRIKLLDQLCDIFVDKVFLGVYPTHNFSSHFRRAMGSSVAGGKETNPERRNNRLEFSRPIPGLSRRKTGSTRLSEFHDLHTLGYQPSADFWHFAFEAKPRWEPTTPREQQEAHWRALSSPPAVPLEEVKKNVMKEFGGPLPVARINYLAVFVFAANSLEKLCSYFSGVKDGTVQPDKDLGFDLVDRVLVDIVDHLRDDTRRLLLPYWRPVKNAKLFFDELDEKNLCLDQYLWKSIL